MAPLARLFLRLAALSGLCLLLFRLSGRRARVLMYHGVCTAARAAAPLGGRGKHVPAPLFRRQMAWLSRHARLLSMDELAGLLARGERIPRRSVAVTLDDGYRNNHEHAWPALREHRVPAVIYVTSGFVEGVPLWIDRLDAAVESATEPALRGTGSGADARRRPAQEPSSSS